jgi:hypothetical protein
VTVPDWAPLKVNGGPEWIGSLFVEESLLGLKYVSDDITHSWLGKVHHICCHDHSLTLVCTVACDWSRGTLQLFFSSEHGVDFSSPTPVCSVVELEVIPAS